MNNMRYTASTAAAVVCAGREREKKKFKYENKKDSNCNKNLYYSSGELCVHMARRSECESTSRRL
jgi:hypothetical protein